MTLLSYTFINRWFEVPCFAFHRGGLASSMIRLISTSKGRSINGPLWYGLATSYRVQAVVSTLSYSKYLIRPAYRHFSIKYNTAQPSTFIFTELTTAHLNTPWYRHNELPIP